MFNNLFLNHNFFKIEVIKNISKHNFFQFILASIPILCITGPFLPDLIVSLSSLIFLLYLFKTKDFTYFKKNFFILFIIFYFVLVLSAILSEHSSSLKTGFFYIRFGLLVILLIFINDKYEKFSYLTLLLLLATFLLLTIDSVFQKFFGYNLVGMVPPYGRITSLFGEDIKLGGFISRLIPLVVALLIFHNFKSMWIFSIIFLGTLMCSISGERISILMIMNFLFLYIFLLNIKFIHKFYIMVLPIIGIFFIIFFSETSKYRLFTVTLSQLNFTGEQAYISNQYISNNHVVIHRDSTILPRIYHMYYETAVKIWRDNMYFGSGPRTYKFKSGEEKYLTISDHQGVVNWMKINNDPLKNLLKKDLDFIKNKLGVYPVYSYPGFTNISGANSHPHNIYLQLMSEIGLIGTLFVLFIFFMSIFFLFKKIPLFQKIIFIGVIINLFPIMFSGNFFNNWLSILYYFPIGFLYLKNKKIK